MSHVTKVNLRVRDLDALDEAFNACGMTLERGKTSFAWWGTFVGDSRPPAGRDPKTYGRCEHAARVTGTSPRNGSSGPWEIGVVPALDGDGYDLLYDEYGGAGAQLTRAVGPGAATLRKEYAFAAASRKAKATLGPKGWTTERMNLPNGAIKLRLRKR